MWLGCTTNHPIPNQGSVLQPEDIMSYGAPAYGVSEETSGHLCRVVDTGTGVCQYRPPRCQPACLNLTQTSSAVRIITHARRSTAGAASKQHNHHQRQRQRQAARPGCRPATHGSKRLCHAKGPVIPIGPAGGVDGGQGRQAVRGS